MNEPLETMMEAREDFMVSPAGDSEPTLRTAHFLKPIPTSSIDEIQTFSEIPSSSLSPLPMFEPKDWPFKVHCSGSCPRKWASWVDALRLRYEAVWKKVGIFEAIMSTKCHILRNRGLEFGVAERWCSQTNTFVFPWGEATITLEDVMVLGGYPVLGDPVFTSLKNQEMRGVEEKLLLARQEPWRSKKAKAFTRSWVNTFMDSGSEIEHEAFLATWLSVFVFPQNYLVNKSTFPIAILLARGNTIALAPAVLASIYEDLGLLKGEMVELTKLPLAADELDWKFEVTLRSPFYLVQIWAWERFKNLQPQPNLTNPGDPILFRWHEVSSIKIDNVRLALDSATDDFLWRPYVRYAGKCRAFYPQNEILVPFEAELDKELASFVTCMRVSELVGIDYTIMQYLPHRVAMQFGMDQDVPAHVPAFIGTKAIAWKKLCRPISDRDLYFPSRLFEADVTTRYARWWKQSPLDHLSFAKNIVRRKRSARSSKRESHVVKANRSDYVADVPPGFPPKLVSNVILGKSYGNGSNNVKLENDADVPPGFPQKHFSTVILGKSCDDGMKTMKIENDVGVPPGFPLKLFSSTVILENSCGNGLKTVKVEKDDDVPPGFLPKHLKNVPFENYVPDFKMV